MDTNPHPDQDRLRAWRGGDGAGAGRAGVGWDGRGAGSAGAGSRTAQREPHPVASAHSRVPVWIRFPYHIIIKSCYGSIFEPSLRKSELTQAPCVEAALLNSAGGLLSKPTLTRYRH